MTLKHDKPIYLEICTYYIQQIELGLLVEGDQLPSVRELAYELGINPNTVSRSYQNLLEQGYIEIVAQKGAFVKKQKEEQHKKAIKDMLKSVKNKITKEELISLVDDVYKGE